MTYNEWRDELKSNLLSVSESERRRVMDYYAEAYADRRDAGFTEREIIEDFGAPYDAAQRILAENAENMEPNRNGERTWRQVGERFKNGLGTQFKGINSKLKESVDHLSEKMEYSQNSEGYGSYRNNEAANRYGYNSDRESYGSYGRENYARYEEQRYSPPPAPKPPQPQQAKTKKKNSDYTWVFVILCIVFCVPLAGIIISLIAASVSICVAPFALLVSGVATIGSAIGTMVGGEILSGVTELGIGLIIFGVSIILIPVFIKLVKLLWQLFGKLFGWIKLLFGGKEKA